MNERHRPPIQREPTRPDDSTEGAATDLDAVRQRAQDLVAAGDAAIERALSGDSRQFLQHSRQHGGQ